MPEEIKSVGGNAYRKFSSSNQRLGQQPKPVCAEIYNGADGAKVCKGPIENARCLKCGLWYGAGIDPRFVIKTKK